MTNLTMAIFLRAHRIARGLRLLDLAVRTGMSIPYISELEEGVRTNPSFDKITKLAQAMKLPTAALMPGLEALRYLPVPKPLPIPGGTETIRAAFQREPATMKDALDRQGEPDHVTWFVHQLLELGFTVPQLAGALHQKERNVADALNHQLEDAKAWAELLSKATGVPAHLILSGKFEDAAD